MEERHKYFEEALSDFVHDAASGGAIRHLVDLGYSVEQICRALSYPTPKERVQRTAYRYMLESGLLRRELPACKARGGDEAGSRKAGADITGPGEAGGKEIGGGFRILRLLAADREKLYRVLYERIKKNGEESCYLSCPFGIWLYEDGVKRDEEWLRAKLGFLNRREQDYLVGIPWERAVLYHRLSSRMQEIGRKLILRPELGCRYYFLETEEIVEGKL